MGNSGGMLERTKDKVPTRENGFSPLEEYAAIGDGRSVAVIALDGSIDWWCSPNMDSLPLFDKLLDSKEGGYFFIKPATDYTVSRQYRDNSNVLETTFKTSDGEAKFTESLNSGTAGRLPWCELARRVEGVTGSIKFNVEFKPSRRENTVSPWMQDNVNGSVVHVGNLLAMLRLSKDIEKCEIDFNEQALRTTLTTHQGSKSMVALLATDGEPLAVPSIEQIDNRIEVSDFAWRNWAKNLNYEGTFKKHVIRSSLSLKLLLYSPSGAIAAAATTSLPEKIGSDKNFDYRYAWVRDACMTIKAFLHAGALEESKAAFTWLTGVMRRNGKQMNVCYTLDGELVPDEKYPEVEGYKESQPVRKGNNANKQFQSCMYGDILECAYLFINAGHVVDIETARLLSELANQCADRWRSKDSGIWELHELQNYTHSKMACWLALDRAIKLAKDKHLEPTWVPRWTRERDRIRQYIDENCWCEAKQSYTFYAGTDKLDASLLLIARVGFDDDNERMKATYKAINKELSRGRLLYRYSGMDKEEGCFIACSFWMVEALAATGDIDEAVKVMEELTNLLDCNLGLLTEMVDPDTKEALGNFPQGLSHLSLVFAANAITEVQNGGDNIEK
ncbi:hypothetical protein AKO1_015078 [Acrasis kona]|uniref:Glycoside hydrolase family 15 protein n=1 Tax=Acrasis kona TaxID=1008807 RepID=A0AAW2YIH4_9EUKA